MLDSPVKSNILIRRDTVHTRALKLYSSALKAAEMGLKLRGARDVDVGMLGSLGVDQGERPNNVGFCRSHGSAREIWVSLGASSLPIRRALPSPPAAARSCAPAAVLG